MQQQLRAYRSKQVDLSGLISNLASLFGCLPNMPDTWRRKFWEHWGTLKVVYSVAVVDRQAVDSAENEEAIAPALSTIERLVDEALRQFVS
jgi:transposase-like protein